MTATTKMRTFSTIHPSSNSPRDSRAGFSLIEVLVALFMATLVFLVIGQMIGVGTEAARSASDMTRVAALAGERLEDLTQSEFVDLVPGGNLNMDVAGYAETLDLDNDGINDYTRRWEVTDLGTEMRLRVRVFALQDYIGPAKETTFVALKADR